MRCVKGRSDAPDVKNCNGNEELLKNIMVYFNGMMYLNKYDIEPLEATPFELLNYIRDGIDIWNCSYQRKYVDLNNGEPYYLPNLNENYCCVSIDYWARYVKGENDAPDVKNCNGNEEFLRKIKVYVNRIVCMNDSTNSSYKNAIAQKIEMADYSKRKESYMVEWEKECDGELIDKCASFADFSDAKKFAEKDLEGAKDIFVWDRKDFLGKIWFMDKDGNIIENEDRNRNILEKIIGKTRVCRGFIWNHPIMQKIVKLDK